MKIAVLASEDRMSAFEQIASDKVSWTAVQDTEHCENFDIFFDLDFDLNNNASRISHYVQYPNTRFVLGAVNIQLEALLHQHKITQKPAHITGINAIPGFLQRKQLEITTPFGSDETLTGFLSTIWEGLISVNSRVGMVTPRIVFMIVNEAFYTLQEGTAQKNAIDTAMKLGTNYPFGPFEALQIFGIKNIFETLNAIYEDTRDERYKICPALKTEYFKA